MRQIKALNILIAAAMIFSHLVFANFCLAQGNKQLKIHPNIALDTIRLDDDFGKHYNLSRHYFSRADLELAELEIQQAIALKPQVNFAHRYYCLLALLRGNLPRAIAELMMASRLGHAIPLTDTELAQLNEQCAKAHYRKGLSYENQRRYPRAMFELRLAHYYAPQNLEIMRTLAFNSGKGGLFDDAEKLYQDSFKVSKQATSEDAFAHADYAYLLASANRIKDAIEQLSTAVQLAPGSAALHVDLSLFQEQAGDLNGATHEMQMAIKTAPEFLSHDVQFSQAFGEGHHAMDWQVRHSDKNRPTYASLWEHLGRLLDKQNKVAGARKAYSRALLLNSQDGLVKARLSELQKQPPIQYSSSAVVKDMEAKNRVVI
jgi:tetratricopeptide (TPR) repeat protein